MTAMTKISAISAAGILVLAVCFNNCAPTWESSFGTIEVASLALESGDAEFTKAASNATKKKTAFAILFKNQNDIGPELQEAMKDPNIETIFLSVDPAKMLEPHTYYSSRIYLRSNLNLMLGTGVTLKPVPSSLLDRDDAFIIGRGVENVTL